MVIGESATPAADEPPGGDVSGQPETAPPSSHGPAPDDSGRARDSVAADASEALPMASSASSDEGSLFPLRGDVSLVTRGFAAVTCILLVLALWWFVTRDVEGDRILEHDQLPNIQETFSELPYLLNPEFPSESLWANLLVTLKRVCFGFGLAAVIGVPLGILAGCFRLAEAFLSPMILFGRNVPIAAFNVLTLAIFGVYERQKIMFIVIACVAFIMADSCQAIRDVAQRYVDTAKTLGANKFQVIVKVLVPLALPRIANSLRLLFGLAFGYIMLVEIIKTGDVGGVGNLLLVLQRRSGGGGREMMYLIILVIPIVAFAIDRLLFLVQCMVFEWSYRDDANRSALVRGALRFKRLMWKAES